MQYIQPPWENYFFSKVQASKKSLFISSPYIKYPVAALLCEILQSKHNPNVSVEILTRVRIQDLIDGASDLEAFEKLLQLAEVPGLEVTVKCISNLHAKVYIFDENSAIVTSSNLTPSGLKSNVEYGIEITEQIAIQQILDDMYAYWSTAETLTVEMIEQVAEHLEATESVVTVDQLKKHSPISLPRIGKRLIPRGQDVEFAELDNLREGIITVSKYRKKSKVIITHPEVPSDVEAEPNVDDNLTDGEIGESTIEIESSYSELEEDSAEWLISELKSDGKQRRKEAQRRLEALFFLDNSCILPYVAKLANANLKLCCTFLGHLQDREVAVSHLLHILNMVRTERGSRLLPNKALRTLNDIAPERLLLFLCKAIKEPLSSNKEPLSSKAQLRAIESLKNAAVKLKIKEKDSAIEILKSLTENTNSMVCNAAYSALGAVGEIKYLRNVFNQAQRLKIPPNTQMSILKGLIDGGVTPEDERMFVRLTDSRFTRFRVMSVRALCQFEKKYWQRLLDMAKSDSETDVRIQAIKALVKIDSTTAHKVLIKLLEDNPEERIKNTIYSKTRGIH